MRLFYPFLSIIVLKCETVDRLKCNRWRWILGLQSERLVMSFFWGGGECCVLDWRRDGRCCCCCCCCRFCTFIGGECRVFGLTNGRTVLPSDSKRRRATTRPWCGPRRAASAAVSARTARTAVWPTSTSATTVRPATSSASPSTKRAAAARSAPPISPAPPSSPISAVRTSSINFFSLCLFFFLA